MSLCVFIRSIVKVAKAGLVNLIKKAESLILGRQPIAAADAAASGGGRNADAAADSFERAWQQAQAAVQADSNSSSGAGADKAEVVVCGNTFAICRKLESLAEAGFRRSRPSPAPGATEATGTTSEAGHDRPHSDTSLIRC